MPIVIRYKRGYKRRYHIDELTKLRRCMLAGYTSQKYTLEIKVWKVLVLTFGKDATFRVLQPLCKGPERRTQWMDIWMRYERSNGPIDQPTHQGRFKRCFRTKKDFLSGFPQITKDYFETLLVDRMVYHYNRWWQWLWWWKQWWWWQWWHWWQSHQYSFLCTILRLG